MTSSSLLVLPARDQRPWWRDAVVYQVYTRSFSDSNGDGFGDINGVRERLDYLQWLGVDALWLNPYYLSPWKDGGYDVADYRQVDPLLGTVEDVEELVRDLHERDMKLIADIVPNHSSDQHVWFQEAIERGPESRAAQRYHVLPGKGIDGDEPPTDWRSVFGGPAWSPFPAPAGGTVPGWWYLHLFDSSQPDLNWDDPDVRADFIHTLRFWFDRGVDGFRIDVAHGLAKDRTYPDDGLYAAQMARVESDPSKQLPQWDMPGTHEIFRDWRVVADAYEPRRAFCGEVWVYSPERHARYLRRDELHTAFNFHFAHTGWNAAEMRQRIDDSLVSTRAVGAPQTWVLSNHDVVRHVTRLSFEGESRRMRREMTSAEADNDLGLRRSLALTTMMMALPGSAYIYQGEELGLPEVLDLPDEVREDPAFARTGGTDGFRDGCRVPLPWSGTEAPFGFSSKPGQPHLPQPADWVARTVEAETIDANSALNLYRSVLAARKAEPALGDGVMEWLDADNDALVAFLRPGQPGVVVVLNTSETHAQFAHAATTYEVLVASSPLVQATADGVTLPPATSVWLRAR